jgi:rhamnosyltransferase
MTSIIVPIRNAPEQAGALLAKLKDQTVSDEIIVVDSSDVEEGAAVVDSGEVRIIRIPATEFDHGGTRTLAAEAAKGDIVVFLSQDALPSNGRSIENLVRPLEDECVGAVYGRQLPSAGASPFAAHLRLFNYPDTSCIRSIEDKGKFGIKMPFLSNAFSAYKKKALLRVGGFKGRLILGEDIYVGAKLLLAGYKIAYAADAAVYHSHNYTALQEFRRYFDIGVFHKSEGWILEEFGGAEGEGMRYVGSGIRYLTKEGRPWLVPEFLLRNFLKYAGYALGGYYERIPPGLVRKFSMHPRWWDA